uniref:Uncharacterized protein n=1 Tax=Panagrolaimus superbus TaxID=310955 RepID=A0A914ZDK5_9BILA
MDDDLEAMLGTVQSPQESRGSTPSRPTASKVEQVSSSGWDADFDVSGDTDNFGSSKNSGNGSGWDDGDWGATEEKPAASQRDRRAELAAKNEQRKKDLAAKKAGKGLGALKLGGGAKGD